MKKITWICVLMLLAGTAQSATANKDVLVCRHKNITAAVSQQGDDLIYTAWSASRRKPDLTLRNGIEEIQGTGVCRHRIYTFKNGAKWVYEMSEIGCTDGSEPEGTKAILRVMRNAQEVSRIYCR